MPFVPDPVPTVPAKGRFVPDEAPETDAVVEPTGPKTLEEVYALRPQYNTPAGKVGMLETGLQMATGTAGAIAGGLAGAGHVGLDGAMRLAALVKNGVAAPGTPPADYKLESNAGDLVRRFQEFMTYQPRTQQGQVISEQVNKPFEAYSKVADWAGQQTSDALGTTVGPLAGTVVRSAIEAAPMLLGPKSSKTVPHVATPPPVTPGRVASVFDESMPAAARSAAANDLLLSKNVPLTRAQRESHTFEGAQAASGGRAADALLGKSPATAEQVAAFSRGLSQYAKLGDKLPTPQTMAEGYAAAEARYAALHRGSPTALDAGFVTAVKDIGDAAVRTMGKDAQPILNQIEQIKQLSEATQQGVVLRGEPGQHIRTELGDMSRNPATSKYAKRLLKELDDAYERSATPQEALDMKDARLTYKRLKQIEAMVAGRRDGLVTPQRANQVMSTQRNKGEYTYGRGDQEFADFIEAGKAKLPEKVGDSGSATRGADVGKLVGIFTHPIETLGTIGSAVGARLFNERGRFAGTPEGARKVQAANAIREKYPGRPAVVTTAQSLKETEDERKRRLRAESLRK